MRKLLLILLFVIAGNKAISQALSDYAFSAFSSTYTTVSGGYISSTGGTFWGSTIYDDCYYDNIPIGFNFVYCGNTYNFVSASQNCWIMLGQTFGTTLYNTYDCDLSNTTTGGFGNFNLPRPILAALWLDVLVTANNVRYATTGTTPNRVFTIEWSNCGLYPSSSPAESVQIKLYETTNIIDFAYSNISSGSTSTGHLSIGITDGSGPYPVTGTIGYWSLNSTGSSPTPSMTTESKFLTGLPSTNQVYRWSPQCVGTPTAGTVSASATSGCTSYTSTLTLSGYSTALGITFQWQSAPTSSGSWTNISGATNSTYTATVTSSLWYRCVVYCTNSGLSAATSPIQLVLNTPPAAITGTGTICVGATLTLASATSGGTWTSGSTGIATVGSSSGVVTGVSPGMAIISYTLSTGCSATAVVTVVAAPSTIGGPSSVCVGQTITLTNSLAGGTWSSSSTAIGTVGASSGVAGGISTGVVTITYTVGACTATKSITVNASPAAISGASTVCVGSSILMTTTSTGGSWSSSNPSVAVAGSSTGVVTGIAGGTVNISYTLPGGCYSIKTVTVVPLPGSITGLPFVCVGQTTTLFASGSGSWSSSNPSVASVSVSGTVTGVSAGTATITFTATTSCFVTFSITVLPAPAPITGDLNLCVGLRDTLASATTGGIWSSSATFIANIHAGAGVDTGISVGTATISYTVGSCSATAIVTVHPSPGTITGPSSICAGSNGSYFSSGGGTWSISNPAVGTISLSGVVTGVAAGTAVVSYTMPSGCYATKLITVNPIPAAISGPSSVCVGTFITLTDATAGGTFSSASSLISVTAGGTVTGISVGTATVTYTLPTGCYITHIVTVTISPASITGPSQVCIGASIPLSNAVAGGVWSSSNPSVATVGSSSGIVNGIATGVATITYSIGASCYATRTITVNPLPSAITGPTAVCVGASITLASPGGGTWASGSTSIAIVGSTTGVVTGVGAGVVSITYTLPTGCSRTTPITVNPVPAAITGPASVCIGSTVTLTSTSGGGTWTSSSSVVATVGSTTGAVTGAAAGVAIITYTIGTGCLITRPVTVHPLPPLCTVTGGGNFCAGAPGRHIGLSCSFIGISYQLYLGTTPVGGPLAGTGGILDFGLISAPGTYTVVATNSATLCSRAMTGSATITVDPPPAPISGPSAVCAGSSITLTDATAGGSWSSSTPSVAIIGATTGVVSGITTGTTTITYTLPTRCQAMMVVTVSPAPAAIAGPSVGCEMTTMNLTNPVPGGAWSSSNPSVAIIGSLSGVVTGVLAGTTTITYSLGSGCTVTKAITINPAPAPISGASAICVGASTTYSTTTTGIVWYSMDVTIATVGSSSGLVTGIATGTVPIICSLMTTGCYATKTLTVNPLPTSIGGTLTVCVNSTTTLTNGIPGGTWTSSSPGIATIGTSSGVVTGVSAGTATITYSLGSGCTKTAVVTVNPLPAAIGGGTQACVGLTTTLTATPGGAWSTTTPSIGTISSAGVVTGISAGLDTIYYTLPVTGCATMRVVTINPLPAPISGSASICVTQTSLLSDITLGGTWTSGASGIATVSSTGLVTGIAFGIAPITYTAGGCWVTTTATVIASPGAIIGLPAVCIGNTITLSNPTPGGTWSSTDPTVATAGSGTGVVTGIASGTVAISYTLGTGCTRIMPVIVNPTAPITGPNSICVGQTALYRDTALGGTWSSSTPSVATISSSGWVTGISSGTTTITYARSGCSATYAITVNPIPAPITGFPFACVGQMSVLADATPGGVWSSSTPAVGTIDASGVVTAISVGYTTISYTLGTGCARTVTFTVNGTPPAIVGPPGVCVGYTVSLTNPLPGGVWSSSTPAVGSIASTGMVRGISTGVTTITYALTSGCAATKLINVDPIPAPIAGPPQVCAGATATYSSATSGGTWSSSSPGIAFIDPVTGVLTGVTPGIVTIAYTMPGGCNITMNVITNPLPAAISGSTNICVGNTTLLSNSVAGGTWSSSAPGTASVGSLSGLVVGISTGTAIISYTLATGCLTSVPVVVNPALMPITGTPNICLGLTTSLSSGSPGGTWSSSNPSIAPVDMITGVVTGAALGTAIITYSVGGSGCYVTQPVFVNPFPAPITGGANVCVGTSITLSDAVVGGTWSSSNPTIASVVTSGPGTGLVTGVSAGMATIYYSLGTGCTVSLNIVVDPAPFPIVGANKVCVTQTIPLFTGTPGGIWSSAIPAVASIGSASGVVTGITAGTVLISYTNSLGCSTTLPVTVNPMPSVITGPTNVCLSGAYTFTDSMPGGKWYSYSPAIVRVDSMTGVITGISLGAATIRYEMPTGCFVTKAVTVYPLPIIFTVTGGGNHCAHDTGVHIGLSGSTVGVNYMLYLGATAVGAFPGTGAPLDFGLHTLAGIYTVRAISTSTFCSVMMVGSAAVGVIPSVTPVVNLNVSPDDTVCVGTTATFTAVGINGGTAPVFSWRVNGIPVSVGGGYAFIPADGDVVTVSMASNAQCAFPSTVSRSITMEVQPFGYPHVSVALLPNDTVCKGTTVTAAAITSYAGSAPAHTWYKNGVVVSYTGSSYSFVANHGDEIFCVLHSNHPCRLANIDSSAHVRATVMDPVLPIVSINAIPGTTVNKGELVTLTAAVVNAVMPTYQWYINGIPVVGATNATFASSSFSYLKQDSVSCKVTSHDVCEVITHQWVYINVVTTGIGQTGIIGDLVVIPNPNKGVFTIKGSLGTINDEEVVLEITNVLGQIIYNGTITAKNGMLNERVVLSNALANGMYLLNLRSGSANRVFHLVVER